MVKQRGRKGDYVSYGRRPVKAIVSGKETGLSRDPSTLLYYYMFDCPKTGKRKKKTCTSNIHTAYKRFMKFVEGQRKEEFLEVSKFKHSKKLKEEFEPFFKQEIPIGLADTGRDTGEDNPIEVQLQKSETLYTYHTTVSEQEYFEWLLSYKGREDELKKISGIAIKFLDSSKSASAIKLKTILDFFEQNINFKDPSTASNYVKWFNHFADFIGKTYVDDITEDDLRKYENEYLNTAREKNGYRYKWKNDRTGAIKKILKFYAEKHPSISSAVKEKRDFMMLWDRKKDKIVLNPECISNEDFWELYEIANTQWRAILLFSLNTMSYQKDIQDVMTHHINFERKFLRMIREKEDSLKVGYLWNQTISALKSYLNEKKGVSKFLFTSERGGQYKKSSLENYLKRLGKKVGMHKEEKGKGYYATFELFRNGGSTAADDGKIEFHYIEYALGHKMTGSFSNYVKRRPERMKPVSDNIYKEYEIDKMFCK